MTDEQPQVEQPQVEQVARFAQAHLNDTLQQLANYLRIPAISCEAAHRADIEKLATIIQHDLEALSFVSQVRTLPGALPIVTAERRVGSDRPTVLIYGHLDLQPVAGEPWKTPPHEATVIGERLYARGAADDMGGWVSHLAALGAWLQCTNDLPCNVKLLVESEEEIGSPNLSAYMDAFPEALSADAMVLTDCENPSTEIPGLTTSLRGLLEVEVLCRALSSDVHSGLWGNMVPDAGNALIRLLDRLLDDDGRMSLCRTEVEPAWVDGAARVPLGAGEIRKGAHLLEGLDPLPERGRTAPEWLWRQPAITILSTTLPRPDQHKNAVRAQAAATLSIRLAPGQDRNVILGALKETLLREPPGGVLVSLNERPGAAESWLYEPSGPAFGAVDRAYKKAWGHEPLPVGVGGSIPFVALFGKRYRDLPLILNGVMDPETGAHGPNESLHLGVFKKAVLANVYLLDEFSRLHT